MLASRSSDKEIMDDLRCSGEVLHRTLLEIEFINRWLGGNSITLNALRKVFKRGSADKISIADLGCGGGGMLAMIQRWAKRQGLRVDLSGIDANPNVIEFARNQVNNEGIEFEIADIQADEFRKKSYDIILCTLLLHHFTTEELVDLIGRLKSQSGMALIINDLHRHPVAYYSIKWLTALFSRSEMVKFDAPLSVNKGFTRREWVDILSEAKIDKYQLNWKWAFRWQLIIYP